MSSLAQIHDCHMLEHLGCLLAVQAHNMCWQRKNSKKGLSEERDNTGGEGRTTEKVVGKGNGNRIRLHNTDKEKRQ